MEPDNQQFSTPLPEKKLPLQKIIKWIFLVVVFLIIILIGIMFWLAVQQNKTQNISNITPDNKTLKIIATKPIVLPTITKLSPLSLKNIPADFQIFIMQEATEQVFNTIQYDNKDTGFQYSYIVASSTVLKTMVEFSNQIDSRKTSLWSLLGASGTGTTSYYDFRNNKTSDLAHVEFSVQNSSVKVVIQSLHTKQ